MLQQLRHPTSNVVKRRFRKIVLNYCLKAREVFAHEERYLCLSSLGMKLVQTFALSVRKNDQMRRRNGQHVVQDSIDVIVAADRPPNFDEPRRDTLAAWPAATAALRDRNMVTAVQRALDRTPAERIADAAEREREYATIRVAARA